MSISWALPPCFPSEIGTSKWYRHGPLQGCQTLEQHLKREAEREAYGPLIEVIKRTFDANVFPSIVSDSELLSLSEQLEKYGEVEAEGLDFHISPDGELE